MAFRTVSTGRQNPVLSPRNYCLTLDPIIEQTQHQLSQYGPAVVMGFDVRELAKAALKHVFYGTVHRGNSYWQVRSDLEHLGVPTDVALGLYDRMYQWIKTHIDTWTGGVSYIEHSYDFLTDTDILIHEIPLHDLPRYPLYD